MSQFTVTPEMVSNAAASCDTTAADAADTLAQLKSFVVNLENSWQGIAQNTFQQLMVDYDLYSQRLHEALTDISAALRGNYVNYTSAEQANISSINMIQNEISSAKLS